MKAILVPTDGSRTAEKALDVALDLAQQHKAAVTLFHALLKDKEPDELLRLPELETADGNVADTLRKISAAPEPEHTAEELMAGREVPGRRVDDDLLRRIGAHILKRAQAQASARGVAVNVLELTGDKPAEAIVAAARASDADAIVMGSRGLRYIEAISFGSVSQEVCRTANCTCVAVH